VDKKNHKVQAIVEEIRNCKNSFGKSESPCYVEKYDQKWPDYSKLINATPLVADWRDQKVLLISQAPSKQAMRDGVLNELSNTFLKEKLLKKLFPESKSSEEAYKVWYRNVFWCHTANCYPGKAKGGDRLPNLYCAKRFLNRLINAIEPQLILLMSWAATKPFAKEITTHYGLNGRTYPSLTDILRKQKESKNLLEINGAECIVIPHLAPWDGKGEINKHAVKRVREILLKL